MKLIVALVLGLVLKFAVSADFDDSRCDEDLNKFDDSLSKREAWAVKLFDTWAKLPSGLLHGNRQSPGHFTECVEFRAENIQGQHCMVSAEALNSNATFGGDFDWREIGSLARANNFRFVQGFCLPASCSYEKVMNYSDKFLAAADMKAVDAICRTNDPVQLQTIDYFAFSLLGFLMVAVLSSTIYEVTATRLNREPEKLFSVFSLWSNGSKLFDTKRSKSPNVINCLHAIRTLSIFWIILGHRFDFRDWIPVYNFDKTESFREKFLFLIYTNYDKPVDTFFVIGGLLATWSFMSAFDKKSWNIGRMYLHRYLRYTPSLAVLILFNMSFMKFLGSGPFFDTHTQNCEKYWWSALLHVTVYTNAFEPCYTVSWYLAADFQMFIITPILVYPLWRWKKKVVWSLPIVILLVQGCTFATTYKHEISVYFYRMATLEGAKAWIEKFYYPTHLRLVSWTVGIMLGFVMYQNRERKIKISKTLNAGLWILALGTLLAIVLGIYPFQQMENNTTTRFGNAMFNSCFRLGWSLAVAWIILACQNGLGGIVNWFLSLRQWKPLGKMGLSIYLVHIFYQIVTIVNEKQPMYWDFFSQLQRFFGDVLVSTFFGAILYLFVENPVLLIESYIYKNIKSESRTP